MQSDIKHGQPMAQPEFERGGFQPDGTYIRDITRQTPGPDGTPGWNPPDVGQTIPTLKGPFRILRIIGSIFPHHGRLYFHAEGEIVRRKK